MWSRVSLRVKITLLVTTLVALGAIVFGRVAYSGLGDLLSSATGLGAKTAAEVIAENIDPQWFISPAAEVLSSEEYTRLINQLGGHVQRGTLARVSIIQVDTKASQATYILSLPEDGSAEYLPPGQSESLDASFLYRTTELDYMAMTLDRPGYFMIGRAPVLLGGEQVGVVLVATDVTRVKAALDTVSLAIAVVVLVLVLLSGAVAYKFASTFEKSAVTDGLMGIYNHKYFKQRLEEEVAKARRYGQQTSLVLFDIDFFKRVNDTYGHATGDLVLKLMAKWVTEMSRNTDVVCRYGGEEVACILPHTGIAGAQEFAERLRLKVSQQVVRDPEEDAEFRVTVSVGVTQWEKGMEMMDMIKAADAALYHSKRTGRNRVTLYQQELLPAPEEMASKPERTKSKDRR